MQHKIQVSKTAIYHAKGNIKTAKTIWIVLHGYGMLAEFFIRKFLPILNDNTCIIAPEGLSKFYSKGFSGRVGATWMTKKDRAYEIEDYINYLNQLYAKILAQNNSENVKINVVGFSQGGATACRWIANGKVTPTNFILWSSAFPDEMKFESFEKKVNTFLLYGDNDEFNTSGRIIREESFLKNSQLNFQLIAFKGGHDIPNEVLKEQTIINNWQ
jgi:predicted esterase